jgi:hypothetical protein
VLSEYLEAHLVRPSATPHAHGRHVLQLTRTAVTAPQADAIRDSLKALFSEPALPDNPYHYLAAALAAYVDQSSLWACTDAALVAALDSNGGLELADASSRLCRLSSCSGVLGLPHVLRCVSKEGAGCWLCFCWRRRGTRSTCPDTNTSPCRRQGGRGRAHQQPAGLLLPWPCSVRLRAAWLLHPGPVVRAGVFACSSIRRACTCAVLGCHAMQARSCKMQRPAHAHLQSSSLTRALHTRTHTHTHTRTHRAAPSCGTRSGWSSRSSQCAATS